MILVLKLGPNQIILMIKYNYLARSFVSIDVSKKNLEAIIKLKEWGNLKDGNIPYVNARKL